MARTLNRQVNKNESRKHHQRLFPDDRWLNHHQPTEGRNEMRHEIVPITFAEAVEFVRVHHRHHRAPVGHKFSIGLSDGEKIVGVVMVGRPVSRVLDNGWTLEVNRLATDGTKNACSMLYATAWRAAKAMGYKKLITYILNSEPGTSLIAAGWKCIGEAGGGSWNAKSRMRVDNHPMQRKIKYEIF